MNKLNNEAVLASASLLRELGLRLYCVPEIAGAGKGCVLSTGKEQVLGIVPWKNQDRILIKAENGLSVLKFPQDDIVPDKLEFLLNCVKRLYGDKGRHRPDPFCPVAPELHIRMADARLIEPGFESYAWEVTPLGKQYGLVCGYLPLNGNRTCRTFFAPKASMQKLKELLTMERLDQIAANAWKVMPMKERLKKLTAGQPGNDVYSVKLLRQLGRMPLEQYMARCPDKLDILRKELPGPPVNTVQEAAARISAAWQQDGGITDQCRKWIWNLLGCPAGNLIPQFTNYERKD